MPITTVDQWFAAPRQNIVIRKTTAIATVSATPFSTLAMTGNPGAGSLAVGNVTNGRVPTDAIAGFPVVNAFNGGATGYLAACSFKNNVAGGAVLYDRLFDVGSIAANALATTTLTAQPAFTSRVPSGVVGADLEMFIEIAVAISATATTVTVNYANEAGTAGRTTGAISINGLTANRLVQLPLQAGDKSVSRIDSIVVGGTVATAGSFNIVLARRLAEYDIRVANATDIQSWDVTGAPIVYADSALWLVTEADSTSSGIPSLRMTIVNG